MMFRSLACLWMVLLSSTALQAQFSASVKALKREHIVGEPVIIRVTMTNYTGQEQILYGERMPWISFIVRSSNGNPILARRASAPAPVRIGPGQTMSRDFNLSRQFQINEIGNYSVSAVIRPSDKDTEGASTNRTHFQLSSGRTYWRQKVGSVGPNSTTREYRLLQFRGDRSTQLYAQIQDMQSGQVIRTARLGEVLMLRKPRILIDGERHLNVLFVTNPTTYLHYRITPDGAIVTQQMHRRAGTGDPNLAINAQGEVQVTNSVLYDPDRTAREWAKLRKITDRPGSTN